MRTPSILLLGGLLVHTLPGVVFCARDPSSRENDVQAKRQPDAIDDFGQEFGVALLDGLLQKSQLSFFQNLINQKVAYYETANPGYAQFLRSVPPQTLLAQTRLANRGRPSGNPWMDVLERNGFSIGATAANRSGPGQKYSDAEGDVIFNKLLLSILKQIQKANIPDPRVNALLPKLQETTNPLLPQANRLLIPEPAARKPFLSPQLLEFGLGKFTNLNPISNFGGIGALLGSQRLGGQTLLKAPVLVRRAPLVQEFTRKPDKPRTTAPSTTTTTTTTTTPPTTTTTTTIPPAPRSMPTVAPRRIQYPRVPAPSLGLSRLERINQMAIKILSGRLNKHPSSSEEHSSARQRLQELEELHSLVDIEDPGENAVNRVSIPRGFDRMRLFQVNRRKPTTTPAPTTVTKPHTDPPTEAPTHSAEDTLFRFFQVTPGSRNRLSALRPSVTAQNSGIFTRPIPDQFLPNPALSLGRITSGHSQRRRVPTSQSPNFNFHGMLRQTDVLPGGQGKINAPGFSAGLSQNHYSNELTNGQLSIPRDFSQGFPTIRASASQRRSNVLTRNSNFDTIFGQIPNPNRYFPGLYDNPNNGRFIEQQFQWPFVNTGQDVNTGIAIGHPRNRPPVPREALEEIKGPNGRSYYFPKGFYSISNNERTQDAEVKLPNPSNPLSLVQHIFGGKQSEKVRDDEVHGIYFPLDFLGMKPINVQFRKEVNREESKQFGLGAGNVLPGTTSIFQILQNQIMQALARRARRSQSPQSHSPRRRPVSSGDPIKDMLKSMASNPQDLTSEAQSSMRSPGFSRRLSLNLISALTDALVTDNGIPIGSTTSKQEKLGATGVHIDVPGLQPLYLGGFIDDKSKQAQNIGA